MNKWIVILFVWVEFGLWVCCGGESFESADEPLPASSASASSSASSSAPASASSSAPPAPIDCPPDKPVIIKMACSKAQPAFCKYKQDCLDTSAPFCYHGLCSDNDPIKKDPCPDNQTAFKEVCYDPWNDELNCGGYDRQCAKGTSCIMGYCKLALPTKSRPKLELNIARLGQKHPLLN